MSEPGQGAEVEASVIDVGGECFEYSKHSICLRVASFVFDFVDLLDLRFNDT